MSQATVLLYLAFLGHKFHITGIFGKFLSELIYFKIARPSDVTHFGSSCQLNL